MATDKRSTSEAMIRCEISVSARLRGRQPVVAQGVAAVGAPRDRAHIMVQLGRVLIILEDRDAFISFAKAAQDVIATADRVFGPQVDEFTKAEPRC